RVQDRELAALHRRPPRRRVRADRVRAHDAVERAVAEPSDEEPAAQRSLRDISETFDDAGERHPEADAHRRDTVARLAALELVEQRRRDARAGRAERMPERDAAAGRVDVLHAPGEPRVLRGLEDDG